MKNAMWIIILVLIVLLAVYGLRTKQLFSNAQKLVATSSEFARDYYVGDAKNPEVLYVAIGDSTAQGDGVARVEETYPYLVAQALAGKGHYVHVRNVAESGARIHGLIQTQLPQLADLSPDYITVTIGANDATHFTPVDNFSTDVKTMLTQFENKKAKVLVATTIDVGKAPALPPIYAQMVTRRSAKQTDILRDNIGTNMTVVDIFKDGKLLTKDLYANDLFHPNAVGYARWAKLFTQSL